MKKRVLSIILSAALVLPGTLTPLAAEEMPAEYDELSEALIMEADDISLTDEEGEEPDQDRTVISATDGEDVLWFDEEDKDLAPADDSWETQETAEASDGEQELSLPADEEEPQFLVIDPDEEEETQIISLDYILVNPLYKDVVTEEQIRKLKEKALSNKKDIETVSEGLSLRMNGIRLSAGSSGTACTTVEEAAAILREGLKNRQDQIVIPYETTDENMLTDEGLGEFVEGVTEAAYVHTGDPLEGDSLKQGISEFVTRLQAEGRDGVYYITVTFTPDYFTDAQQEQILSARETEVLNSLGLTPQTQYGKIKTIYGYICDNVTYDYANLDNEEYLLKYSPYAALINKTAVCQGYAVLLYQMLLRAGVDARVISGAATSTMGHHDWNIISLDGKYYNADSTWDSGYTFEEYSWFLKNASDFTEHYRDAEYDDDQFNALYPMSLTSYVETETVAPLKTGKVTVSKSTYNRYTHRTKDMSFTIDGVTRRGTGKLTYKSDNSKIKVSSKGKVTIAANYAGTAKITIKAASDGVYKEASTTVTVKVTRVKKPTVSSLKNSASKAMTLTWSPVSVGSGYQIRYAANKSFTSGVKTITVSGRTAKSKKITGLKKGSRYYVKIRAYKTSGGTKYYSAWSTVKNVKISK